MVCWLAILAMVLLCGAAAGLRPFARPPLATTRGRILRCFQQQQQQGGGPQEADSVLQDIASAIGKRYSNPDSGLSDSAPDASAEPGRSEELFRKYPFEHHRLPTLPDHNNYYSGKSGENFWLQNADQVLVYLPIAEDVQKRDIKVQFQAKRVTVWAKGEELASFPCEHRIVPEGCFWVIEPNHEGKRFVQLDLEKRLRMINWRGLFQEASEPQSLDSADRSRLLEQLLQANQGLSKLTGMPADSAQDILSSEAFKRFTSSVSTRPEISYETEDGTLVTPDFDEESSDLSDAIPTRIEDLIEASSEENDEEEGDEEEGGEEGYEEGEEV